MATDSPTKETICSHGVDLRLAECGACNASLSSNQCIYCGYLDGTHNEVCTVSTLQRQLECTGMSPGAAENTVGLIAALIAGRVAYETRRRPAVETSGWRPIDMIPDPQITPVLGAVQLDSGDFAVGEMHQTEVGWYWAGNDPSDSWGGQIYPAYWQPLPRPPLKANGEPVKPWTRGGDPDGTHRVGYAHVPYSKVVEVFGEPRYLGDQADHRVIFEWVMTFADGAVATIYDYKQSKLYGDDPDAPTPDEMKLLPSFEWHIGGKSQRAVELVLAALNGNE